MQILNLSQIGRLFLIKNMKSVHNPRKTLFKCTLDSLYYKNGNIIVCPCDNIGYSYLLDISIKQPEAFFSRISNFEHCKLLRRLLVLMCNHYTLYKNIGKNCLAVTIIQIHSEFSPSHTRAGCVQLPNCLRQTESAICLIKRQYRKAISYQTF